MNSKITHNPRGKKIQLRHRQDLKEIENELLKGTPYSDISFKYNVQIGSLTNYKKKYLSKKMNIYKKKSDIRSGEFLYKTLEKYINNVNNIADSCVRALKDPNNPDNIDVSPQGTDVDITYIDTDGKKHKDTLQNIIDGQSIDAVKVEISTPDRVKTLLEASHAMNKHLNLLADIKGMIGNTTINIANQPMFIEFVQAVVKILDPYPVAKRRLIEEIRQMSKAPILDVDPATVLHRPEPADE